MSYLVDTSPYFDDKLLELIERFPTLLTNYEKLVSNLENAEKAILISGQLGAVIPNVSTKLKRKQISPIKVFKLRLPNPDANKGKRGGFRIIYYLNHDISLLRLLSIYYKGDKENITERQILSIIESCYTMMPK